MSSDRSYDIECAPSLEADLEQLGEGAARRCLRRLYQLTDDDIHDWEPLPVPRSDEGSWVVFTVCKRRAMCQFAKGTPRLWILGVSRGCLKVVRIVEPEALWEAVRALESED